MTRLALLTALIVCAEASAQVVLAPPNPQVGSPQPATANPKVPRPGTRPCVVHLFENMEFADYNPKAFDYTPPPECHGPWAKVVFTADFTVTEGNQYDRTGSFYLGHANIYYGTTAEPGANLSPDWHVERDVTDLSAIFKSPQTGEAILGNFVGTYNGVVYNGIIYADAALEFYPASPFWPAPSTPDVVVPMPDAEGGAVTLNTTSSQLTQTVNLPENVERAYLDIITQSQIGDEFWYTCVPNDVASELQSCGNTAFREAEISIDGQPAGVAPVYPWIYTGGIDPFLWAPIPGVQTYEFTPYRVDLTPFAGLLSDGSQHTVALSVYNANNYFLATANLFLYTDHGAKKVTGSITSNNLSAAPSPIIQENITTAANGDVSGIVTVTSTRDYSITGFVNTSHGKVETTAGQIVQFSNSQHFNITSAEYVQDIHQSTFTVAHTSSQNGSVVQDSVKQFEYPLVLNYSQVGTSTGIAVTTTVQQSDIANTSERLNGFPIYDANLLNEVNSTDTLNFDSSGNFTGPSNRDSWQRYVSLDSLGYCYDRVITSADGLLASIKDEGCWGH
ncbi:MAG: peptide-N(4)-(N-acetyl-beta-glucosaminyl)asparagine amidase [Acidobacteriaceae bacterium]|nr:peptide-N(4)-(N-acetyl-beta-glucosaminyl)asparagine amidase [Acidobacteriaceae bacterium]